MTKAKGSKTTKSEPKKASKRDVATYVYCLVAGKKAPSLAMIPQGVPNVGETRVLEVGRGFWALVGDAPLDEFAAEPIESRLRDLDWVGECALGHEAIVEYATTQGTVVPMKLFTLFDSDARAAHHVEKSRKDLERVVSRIENKDEWGLRVHLDEPRALEREKSKRAKTEGKSAGASFLLRKKAEQDASKALLTTARARANEVFEELAEKASLATKRSPTKADGAARIVLEAAFLVEKKKGKSFVSAVEKAAGAMIGDGYELALSGPWPAYHFIAEPEG